MKTPASLGLPAKFSEWRKGQMAAVRQLLFSKDRFVALVSPTGAGKSATYMAQAAVDDEGRICVLTATRLLQTQLLGDFHSMGMIDIRGRSNYVCDIDESRHADTAVCVMGKYCRNMKDGPCGFYDRKREALQSRIVITNYSYWLEHQQDLGYFTTLVLDEAHKAPDEISRFAAVEIRESELDRLKLQHPPAGLKASVKWALSVLGAIDAGKLTGVGSDENRRLALRLRQKLSRMCRLSEHQWLRSKEWKMWRWDLVDPSALAEDLLFRGSKKVVLSSASLRKKTLKLLGVEGGRGKGVTVIEQESTFPVSRRPIYFWPVVRMNKNTQREEFDRWHEAIDEIIGARLDRNGLIHTVSYERAVTIWQRSRYQDRMLLHEKKQGIEDVVRQWREMPRGTVLLSPALTEGVNLAYQDCEYAIVAKIPFPDFTAPLMRARAEKDDSYTSYLAMQALVQAVGRHVRAVDDQGETFILDSALQWLRVRYWDFAPHWFHTAVKTLKKDARCPKPIPSLWQQDPNRWGRS